MSETPEIARQTSKPSACGPAPPAVVVDGGVANEKEEEKNTAMA